MLTKGDLSAIKSIVRGEIKDEINGLRTELKDEIKDVRTELISAMNKNTDDLVEIITTGFSTHEAQYQNHEVRIIHLEKTPLPSN
jgi:hypothetical protein